MKKPILLFLIMLGLNSLVAQINNNIGNPSVAPNSGVQPPPSGAPQTTGPDFQPTTPYMETVPPPITPVPGQAPSTQTITPQTQNQPSITTPNSSGTNNSLYANPTNTLAPGSPPTSPPRNK